MEGDDRYSAITGGCHCWACRHYVPRSVEALTFISLEAKRMERGMRRAEVTPREGVQAGLQVLQLAADNALGKERKL